MELIYNLIVISCMSDDVIQSPLVMYCPDMIMWVTRFQGEHVSKCMIGSDGHIGYRRCIENMSCIVTPNMYSVTLNDLTFCF